MANDFTSVQQDQASDKFLLIRIEPARSLNSSLANTTGTLYQASFPFLPSRILRNGQSLTQVSSSPSTDQFSFNASTNNLTINLAAAPSSTNVIVAFYYIFLTQSKFRILGSDPETPGADLRDWEPKLLESPEATFSIKNVLEGIVSISNNSLTMINDNDDFNKYLGDKDSFFQKNIKIWQCLNTTENIKKLFEGKTDRVSVSRTTVQIFFQDVFSQLKNDALMGDSLQQASFSLDEFPNIDRSFRDEPIRFCFGRTSRYSLRGESVTNLSDAKQIAPGTMNRAICTSFTNNLTTSNNREWGICRVDSNGFEDFSFSPSVVDNTDPNFTVLTGTTAEIAKFFTGDTFEAPSSNYNRVLFVDYANNQIYITKNASISTSTNITSNLCPTIVISDGNGGDYYPLYGQDYTATESTLISGNKYLKINFVNNFESRFGLTVLDPVVHFVEWRVKPSHSNQNHSDVLKKILEAAGITVNNTSFSSAKTALNVNANFTIPFFDETNFRSYFVYIEELLKSTLGYIYLNNDFELVYKLFEAPSSTDVVTDTDIIENSYNVSISYLDLVTQIVAFNPHYSSIEVNNLSSQTAQNLEAKYLHEIDKTTRFRHVLEDLSSLIDDHIAVRSNRKARYSFRTKQINYLSSIGDDLRLSKKGIPGQQNTKDIKIFTITKKDNETRIEANDLVGL